jgi:hypothetical protein
MPTGMWHRFWTSIPTLFPYVPQLNSFNNFF